MEWSWLKDWWRLKKLRRNNQLRHNNGDDVNDDASNSGYEDEDFDDMCYCDECMNVRFDFLLIYLTTSFYSIRFYAVYDSRLIGYDLC